MIRRYRRILSCAVALLPIVACTPTVPTATSAPAANPHQDAIFLREAPVAVLQGETFAKLAASKATDPALRSQAATMAHDYGDIGQRLAPLVRQNRALMPDQMDGQHQVLYHQMESLGGATFDRDFVQHQMQDLTTTIELFQAEADSGKQPELQGVARDSLPVLMQGLSNLEPLSHGR